MEDPGPDSIVWKTDPRIRVKTAKNRSLWVLFIRESGSRRPKPLWMLFKLLKNNGCGSVTGYPNPYRSVFETEILFIKDNDWIKKATNHDRHSPYLLQSAVAFLWQEFLLLPNQISRYIFIFKRFFLDRTIRKDLLCGSNLKRALPQQVVRFDVGILLGLVLAREMILK